MAITHEGAEAAAAAFLDGSPVPALTTAINTADPQFRGNRERLRRLVEELQASLATVRAGGGKEQVERHRSRGKLTARDRVHRLLDPGTAFLELSPLAAWNMYSGDAPGAGIVSGIGRVCDREVVVIANDATVKG